MLARVGTISAIEYQRRGMFALFLPCRCCPHGRKRVRFVVGVALLVDVLV